MATVLDEMPETDVVTTEVLQQLIASIGENPASDYATANVFTFVGVVKTALPDLTDKALRKQIATEVHQFLDEMGILTSASAAAAAPQGPIEVTVNTPKGVDDLTLQELIERIIADPSQSDDLIPVIREKRQVRAAEAKTREWAIANTGGGLNVTATVAYATFLARPHTVVQRKWEGDWPTTLERALGIDRRVMIHPFTGQPLDGPDEFGFDWTKLSDEQHEAVIWAMVTRHRNLPASPDVRRMSDELFADELPSYWAEIVEDYARAKARGDSSTNGITRYVPEDVLDGLSGRAASTFVSRERTEEDYKAMLFDNAMGAISRNSSFTKGEGIIPSLYINGSCRLNGTIVLQGGTVNGSASGHCYVPRGVSIQVNGSSSMDEFPRSYKKLCEIAGLI